MRFRNVKQSGRKKTNAYKNYYNKYKYMYITAEI